MTTPCQYLRIFSLFISFLLVISIAPAQSPGDDPDGLILLDEVVGVSQGGGNIIDNIPSDQRKGSLLVYNLYTSSASNPGAENTRINITNTSEKLPVAVHLFFIDGETCSVADSIVCLTANQTVALLASDVDPGVTGYLLAVAESRRGFSATFNALIGDAYIKMASGYFANIPAIGFSEGSDRRFPVEFREFFGVPPGSETLFFIGRRSSGGYSRLPRVLALNSIPSRADGFETLLIINRIGGSLISGLEPIGNLFGFVFDDQENPYSFTAFANTCQLRMVLGDSFPRTAPRLSKLIPAAQTGWMKIWSTDIDQRPNSAGTLIDVDRGILGAVLYKNSVTGFSGGHNLHALSFTNRNQVIEKPLFPTNCNLE